EKGPNGQLLNPPPPPKPDPKTQAIQAQGAVDMAKAQQSAAHDAAAANQDMVHMQTKAQGDRALAAFKAEVDARMKLFEAHLQAKSEDRAAGHENTNHHVALAGKVADLVGRAHAHDANMTQGRESHERNMEA